MQFAKIKKTSQLIWFSVPDMDTKSLHIMPSVNGSRVDLFACPGIISWRVSLCYSSDADVGGMYCTARMLQYCDTARVFSQSTRRPRALRRRSLGRMISLIAWAQGSG